MNPATPAAPPSAPTRRERLREQTRAEIKHAARAQLVTHGPRGIQLRAIARDVGLTAPALYRYFPSLEELTEAVTVDLFDELCDAMESSANLVTDPFARMLELSRAFRRWAISHPHEFGLLFGVAPTALGEQPSTACQRASDRFGNLFATAFISMWDAEPFPVAPDDTIAPEMRAGLTEYWTWLTTTVAPQIPLGALVLFLDGWVRIFGSVTMEAFGHLSWAMPDAEPMFEEVMRGLAVMVSQPEAYAPPLFPMATPATTAATPPTGPTPPTTGSDPSAP